MAATVDLDGEELERAFDEAAWDAEEDGNSQTWTSSDPKSSSSNPEAIDEVAPTSLDVNSHVTLHRAPIAFLQLPREMLLRVLSLIPATSLTSCACVCKVLGGLASDDTLWRRLYFARWGKPSFQVRGNAHWKCAYLDTDREEWEATIRNCRGSSAGDDPAMSAIFLDMLRAKRDTSPDRRLLDRPLQLDPGDIAAKVAAWRRARGFQEPDCGASGSGDPPPPPPRPDLSRRGRALLTFTRVNPGEQPPVYACDQTGWVHVCGDDCTEGEVDARSELLVCPVSGQTTDRLVHECEEEEADDGRRCGGGVVEEEGGLGVFGGFGSFFTAGYECENEKALNKLLGYKAL